jgi:hypothetical protein
MLQRRRVLAAVRRITETLACDWGLWNIKLPYMGIIMYWIHTTSTNLECLPCDHCVCLVYTDQRNQQGIPPWPEPDSDSRSSPIADSML